MRTVIVIVACAAIVTGLVGWEKPSVRIPAVLLGLGCFLLAHSMS